MVKPWLIHVERLVGVAHNQSHGQDELDYQAGVWFSISRRGGGVGEEHEADHDVDETCLNKEEKRDWPGTW